MWFGLRVSWFCYFLHKEIKARFLFKIFDSLTDTRSVVTTLFLGFWTENSIPGFKQGSYMGVYVALGTNFLFLDEISSRTL